MIALIPLAYLNEACFLSVNTDEKKYKMNLKLAQDNLREVLGGEFYEQIETQYDGATFSTANNTLYENYIKDFLAWETYWNYLKFSQSDATPTGLRQFKDENSDILSDMKLAALEKNVQQQANTYKNKLINYLKNEQDKDSTAFPLWDEPCRSEFSFGITAVNGKSDASFRVDRTVIANE